MPDEAELLPQNDQPGAFGNDGLDSERGRSVGGGFHYNHQNMSNESLGGDGGGQRLRRRQREEEDLDELPQRDEESVVRGGGGSSNNDNGKGFNDMDIQCPSFTENSACPCYKFDDGE